MREIFDSIHFQSSSFFMVTPPRRLERRNAFGHQKPLRCELSGLERRWSDYLLCKFDFAKRPKPEDNKLNIWIEISYFRISNMFFVYLFPGYDLWRSDCNRLWFEKKDVEEPV